MSTAILEKLDRALGQIDRPGNFCVSGRVPAILPGLEVEGLGPVGLPLTARMAQDLIEHCHRAPYGKGEKTLVDTSVRRVWRLEPDHFALTNLDWDRVMKGIVARVQEELGLENQTLESHLYDLLLYEPGSFFLPHRDGEKRGRMVATLVVVLPSSHEGGALIVRHDGQERTIDFGAPAGDPFHIHYAAFYADCEHEVQPLKKGHRLCLIYNLTLAKSLKSLPAPRDSEHVETIAPLIQQWASDEVGNEKVAILLDHQYTQDGLTWDALKGTDRVKARVLAEAARKSGCKAHLALLTLHQSGTGEDDGGYRYGRRPWYGRHGEDEDDGVGGEHTMVEIYETSLTAEYWSDPEGHRLPIGKLNIEENEVLDPKSLTAVKPEEDYEGYTGNEGMTLDRWYRHAAIFLWSETRHFEVICDRDSRAIVPELARMIEQRKRAGTKTDAAVLEPCRELAAAIVARWPEQRFARMDSKVEDSLASGLLECLLALDLPGLIGDFLGGAMIRDSSADPGKTVATIGQKYGWQTLQPQLTSVMKATTAETIERNVRLLESICTTRPRKKEGWADLAVTLGRELVAAIERLDGEGPEYDWRAQKVDRATVLASMVRSLIASGQSERLSGFLDHTIDVPGRYPLTDVHIKALADLRPWLKKNVKKPSPPLAKWLNWVREQLEALTAREPAKPADFRRAAPITCACSDCAELKRFLVNPHEAVHRFKAAKERRRHLHSQIDTHKIDLTHVTERIGSPQTLVCTKTTASYQASLKKYHEDREHLKTIKAIGASLPK